MEQEHQVKLIKGIEAVSGKALPFIIRLHNGMVMPAAGATILDLGNGKFLATAFGNEGQKLRELLEITEINGVSVLGAAAN